MWASASGVTRLVAPGPGRGHADADARRWRRRTPGRRGRRPARGGPGCAGSRSPSAGRTPGGSRRPGCRRCAGARRLQRPDQALRAGHRSRPPAGVITVSCLCRALLPCGNKKPLGRRAARGDAWTSLGSARASRAYKKIVLMRMAPRSPPRPDAVKRVCQAVPAYWDGRLTHSGARRSAAPPPGGQMQALLPCGVGEHPEPRRVLVGDQRAAGLERGGDPLLGDLRRHPDVEVEALPRLARAARCPGTTASVAARRGRELGVGRAGRRSARAPPPRTA